MQKSKHVRRFDAWTIDCPACNDEFTLVDDISGGLARKQDHIFCCYCGAAIDTISGQVVPREEL